MKRIITILSAALFMALLTSPMAAAKSGTSATLTKRSTGGFSFGSRTFTRTRTRSSTASNTTTETATDTSTGSASSSGLTLSANTTRSINTDMIQAIQTTTSKQDQIASKKASRVMRSLANSPVDDVRKMIRAITGSTITSSRNDALDLLN